MSLGENCNAGGCYEFTARYCFLVGGMIITIVGDSVDDFWWEIKVSGF